MGTALERRLRKLEQAAGALPCQKPGHDGLFLFIHKHGDEHLNAEMQAKIQSIRNCERCKDKPVVSLMIFGEETNPPQKPKDGGFEFNLGEQNSDSHRAS